MHSFSSTFLLLASLGLGRPGEASDFQQSETPADGGNAEARSLWSEVCAAARPQDSARDPIVDFVLRADVLLRKESQSNDLVVDYRYKSPDLIRFKLPSGRETGKTAGTARSAYWLRDGDELVRLTGRENAEDRRQVDEMVSVAHNFLALSQPEKIELTKLDRKLEPPRWLPKCYEKEGASLSWLVLVSTDFALLPEEGAQKTPLYTVELGIGPKDRLPKLAIIHPTTRQVSLVPPRNAVLIKLDNYRDQAGFRIPFTLLVHRLDLQRSPPAFSEKPDQEIWVKEARLNPGLTPRDFEPE